MVSGFNITVFFHTISTIEYPLSTSNVFTSVKGALSVLRQFLATESPLQMMKNALYFTLKTLFTLKIFKFLSWLFGHVKIDLKFMSQPVKQTINNTHIARYLKK